jgi:N-acetylmuramic acid 6-phosphate etherase
MAPGTEARNPRTTHIDQVDTLDALRLLHTEDVTVTAAVKDALPTLAKAVDAAADRLATGGALHYFGAGGSGVLGLLDASELPGTFGWDRSRMQAHVAGGLERIGDPDQSVEDDAEAGARAAEDLTAADVAVGITASGSTPKPSPP